MLCMKDVSDSQIGYDLLLFYLKYPRRTEKELREKISPYKSNSTTQKLFNRIRKNEILFGPILWVNSGFVIDLIKNGRRNSLELFEKYKKIPVLPLCMR